MHKLLGAAALVTAIAINAPASAADDATAVRNIELEAYRASCAGLLASMMKATGKSMGAARGSQMGYRMREAGTGKVRCPAKNRRVLQGSP
jgi:hypothetical protein